MLNVTDTAEVESCYRSYIVIKPNVSYIINSIIGIIVNIFLCIVGTFLNTLVVYVFWKTPKLRNKVSYFMIMILSSIDILVTTILHPLHILMSMAEIVQKANCDFKMIYHITAVVLSGMSFFTFFLMNVERYLSIVHPLFHMKYVTKTRCFGACMMLCPLTIFCGPIAYPLRLNVQLVITVIAVIIMVGTCHIYFSIFCIAKKKKQCFHHRTTNSNKKYNVFIIDLTKTESQIGQVPHQAKSNYQEDKKPNKTVSFLHDLQLAKTYLLVVFSSFFLNLPNAIVLAAFHAPVEKLSTLVQFKIWTVTFVLMNSTINSLIFFWANKRLSVEGKKICKQIFKR
ncbi:uncharacterized protein LOC124444081 [Xenia sp. Carnegie-2017]|uniref:uncharacterized protein LOC124444081 n=1 Tax=Xenia sp. Carnegie-2017 TaxID=2897299 RepID=UPI001F03BAAB|nr:uncharacterized protein LOC124444081 [Xenia sp. Carnegie-2017]